MNIIKNENTKLNYEINTLKINNNQINSVNDKIERTLKEIFFFNNILLIILNFFI